MNGSFAVAIAGVAGSGKSTLGRELAKATGAALLDLDTVTNPLLDRLSQSLFPGHWLASAHAQEIREGRYAALAATAREVRSTAGSVVIVAPFTAELRGGEEFARFRDAVGDDLLFVRLVGDAEVLRRRRAQRDEERDLHRSDDDSVPSPNVAHTDIDIDIDTGQQLERALAAIGFSPRRPPSPAQPRLDTGDIPP